MTSKNHAEQLKQAFGSYCIEWFQRNTIAPAERIPELLKLIGVQPSLDGSGIELCAHPDVPGSEAIVRTFDAPPLAEVTSSVSDRFTAHEEERRAVLATLVAAGDTAAGADPDDVEFVEMSIAATQAEREARRVEAKQEALQEILEVERSMKLPPPPKEDQELLASRDRRKKTQQKLGSTQNEVESARSALNEGHVLRRRRAATRLEQVLAALDLAVRDHLHALEEEAAEDKKYAAQVARWEAQHEEQRVRLAAIEKLLGEVEDAAQVLNKTVEAPAWKLKEIKASRAAIKHVELAEASTQAATAARETGKREHRSSRREELLKEADRYLEKAASLLADAKKRSDFAEKCKEKAGSKTASGKARAAVARAQKALTAANNAAKPKKRTPAAHFPVSKAPTSKEAEPDVPGF